MTAPIVPPPTYHAPVKPRYILITKDGAAPLRYEWNEVDPAAISCVHPATPTFMLESVASKFHAMERHQWTRASGAKVELEIVA